MANYISVNLTEEEIEHIITVFDMCGTAGLNPRRGTIIEDRINTELCSALQRYRLNNNIKVDDNVITDEGDLEDEVYPEDIDEDED